MSCSECGGEQLDFTVPEELREFLRGDSAHVALCTRCLTLDPIEDAPDDLPDFTTISDAFPNDDETAATLALAVGLLADSLTLHRAEIESLLERVERAGTDPLLAIDYLATDPNLEPAFDWERRQVQLEQLLYE
ncbi:DUF6276 family protein [Halorussus halophilus]|uniref:DUF6276 family protein n=1 Tax=Halorussus halophilus TaxID=2650975 RepID=UPI001300DED0|nr:DUF6276 family protein [Halorussus halophilus]